MKAIEINARTDKSGHLKIDYPVNKPESNVRIIILVDEKPMKLTKRSYG